MEFRKFEQRAPSAQTAVEIFAERWACDLGEVVPGVTTGSVPAFGGGDQRPRAAAAALGRDGRLDGMSVLELGPLEGGHTYQLEQLGAGPIVAVEANAEAYLKCLVVKELLGLRARFLFGDCVAYLEGCRDEGTRFDLIFCSGVLYHMAEPLRLIELIPQVTDRCLVWTHYREPGGTQAMTVVYKGFSAVHWIQPYGETSATGRFWGGNKPFAALLQRDAIVGAFGHFGLDRHSVCAQSGPGEANPHICFAAWRASEAGA